MVKYIIIHNTHNGCYDFKCYQDEVARIRLTSITINPPKLYLFNTRDEAQDFFEEYINDVDCIDIRCKKGDEVEHIDYCTCGVIELDENGEPILFYNKKNQIFLLEHGPEVFLPNQELKDDVKNLNLTNRLINKCKTLGREQRNRYIELGKYCEECNENEEAETNDNDTSINKKDENTIVHGLPSEEIKITIETKPELEVQTQTTTPTKKTPVKRKPKDNKGLEENKEANSAEKKKKTYTKKQKNTEPENK